jgi:hypothetical protein
MSSIMSTAGSRLSATVRSRRGGEEKAQVTGKATLGAAANKSTAGINNGLGGNRRQAYSRNRRHSSLGGSAMAGEKSSNTSRSELTNNNSSMNSNLTNNNLNNEETMNNALNSDLQAANAQPADPTQGPAGTPGTASVEIQEKKGMKDTLATAVLGAKGREDKGKEKSITAKDIFNNMNQSHKSKDSDRKFGGAGPTAGGGSGQVAGSAQPVAPSASYRAPEIANNSNVVSGSAAGTPIQIVAVPVQIDTSSLLGQSHQQAPSGLGQAPVTGTEEKAKARANKYLFDTESDLESDRNKQDILGHKDTDVPTEQPHVPVGRDRDDNE